LRVQALDVVAPQNFFARTGMQIRECWAEIDGHRMHYLSCGNGPALLLVHGLLGGSFCWRFNLEALAERFTVYALDLPGLGLSAAPRTLDCSMGAQAKRLLSFMEQTCLEQVDVIGSSWGGGVGMLLAALTPRVRSLVLAAPVNPWSQWGRERVEFFSGRLGSLLVRYGLRLPPARRYHRPSVEAMYGDRARIAPGTLEGYAELIRVKNRGHNLVDILRSWQGDVESVRQSIANIHAPALLVWGTWDRAVDPSSMDILECALPRCRRAVLPGVGHLPFEEVPEVFNRLVLDFVGRMG
jgi:pimeloyl-ACP methyl ester carboxylesterase